MVEISLNIKRNLLLWNIKSGVETVWRWFDGRYSVGKTLGLGRIAYPWRSKSLVWNAQEKSREWVVRPGTYLWVFAGEAEAGLVSFLTWINRKKQLKLDRWKLQWKFPLLLVQPIQLKYQSQGLEYQCFECHLICPPLIFCLFELYQKKKFQGCYSNYWFLWYYLLLNELLLR